ncbi:hypothetical protein EG831_08325, partial [bacterium]|nr:hypothetical protein [bacterium]
MLTLIAACSLAAAQPVTKPTLAVLELDPDGYRNVIALELTDSVSAALARGDSFELMDNSTRRTLLDLKGEGGQAVRPDSAGIAQAGALLRVERIVSGSIAGDSTEGSISLVLWDARRGAVLRGARRRYRGSEWFVAQRAGGEAARELVGLLPPQGSPEVQPPVDPAMVARYEREKKHWFIAAGLSYLWAGAGHFYTGEPGIGFPLAATYPFVVLAALGHAFDEDTDSEEHQRANTILSIYLGIYIADVVLIAPLCAQRRNDLLKRKYGLTTSLT